MAAGFDWTRNSGMTATSHSLLLDNRSKGLEKFCLSIFFFCKPDETVIKVINECLHGLNTKFNEKEWMMGKVIINQNPADIKMFQTGFSL